MSRNTLVKTIDELTTKLDQNQLILYLYISY